jgi:maleamate amidohydrolase
VGDRNAAIHESNLFDINAKYGDVIDLASVEAYLAEIATR